ncbi:DEAD/DEAH box helicase family protein [Tritrichomonas foetus]|uniref:ATP-dependent RNA helicase n=1 Tax=Tritrichomonas foetus TaxID=1144522 RepID=A0A1J4L085_9EUKA|nr:DEAD/DEAH box helicase family protein [Tritrichomonas foetus]|eukprot:OHT15374.1 DEAD/DEAH box helicase family protein [Tritrichomonas foetus]
METENPGALQEQKPQETKEEQQEFNILDLSPLLKENLAELKFSKMMKIQQQAIPEILAGKDILAAAKTGSGKTLAFLVPAIDYMIKNNIKPENGITTLVIAPTRELAVQTNGVATQLLKNTGISNCLSIGGTQKKAEAKEIAAGVNLLVATPGRLCDHILGTSNFSLHNVKLFVIDEADRILEIGFHTQLEEIIRNLPKERQTMLFSATLSQDISNLASISFSHGEPFYIGVDDQSSSSTAAGLSQSYIICPPNKRLFLLYKFLRNKNTKGKKIMIFFSTRSSVKFHQNLFSEFELKTLAIHGDQSQQKRTDAFNTFREKKSGIMLCTDVAARGLDIPAVDFVIQYDPPTSEKEYIHRVGRSARAGAEGSAILFLMKNEVKFLEHLKEAKVPLTKLEMPSKLFEFDLTLKDKMSKNRKLLKNAKEALKSYLMAYESHALNDCFDIRKLDIEGIAKSFGFDELPQLDIRVSEGKSADDGAWIKREKKKRQGK